MIKREQDEKKKKICEKKWIIKRTDNTKKRKRKSNLRVNQESMSESKYYPLRALA